MTSGAGETKEDLLAAMEGRHPLTHRQLARWHRKGLLPQPTQVSLGKGLGSQSVYPAGTRLQLEALCRIHFTDGERRMPYVARRLWWEGFDVSLDALLEAVMPLAELWEGIRAGVDPETASLSDEAWDIVNKSGATRSKGRTIGQARRRIGKQNMSGFMRNLVEIFSGRFEDFEVLPGEDSESRVFRRAIGNRDLTTNDWRAISRHFRNFSPVEDLVSASYEELTGRRDAVKRILALLASWLPTMGPTAKVAEEVVAEMQETHAA
ncbi:MAG: hypothetical protein M3Z66_25335, partial [Chloroflexota bacterium]|nr:hypothetical protein [Chloroflexota bacterium]